MPRKAKLDTEKTFEAYYLYREVEDRARLTTREIADRLGKQYGVPIDHTNISRAIAKVRSQIATDPAVAKAYEEWKATRGVSRKVFYRTDPITSKITSDYVTVQAYIDKRMRAARPPKLSDLITLLKMAEKCWLFLDRKDPANWEESDVLRYLAEGRTLESKPHTAGTKLSYLGACRQVAPKVKAVDDGTKEFKKENRRQNPIIHSPIFLKEFKEILSSGNLEALEKFTFKLHVVLGCREGYDKDSLGNESSLLGLKWSDYDPRTEKMQIFESKAVGWWKNIPLDALDPSFKREFREFWERQGRPTTGYLLPVGETLSERGKFLKELYRKIKESFPHLINQKFTPHFGRKTHANILWELGYPSEVIIGDAQAGEGFVGAGETDLSTYQKYYLSLSKSKLDEYRKKAKERFNEVGA